MGSLLSILEAAECTQANIGKKKNPNKKNEPNVKKSFINAIRNADLRRATQVIDPTNIGIMQWWKKSKMT